MPRHGRFKVTQELLVHNLMCLPANTSVVRVSLDENCNIEFVVESPDLPDSEGEAVPIMFPTFQRGNGQAVFTGWRRDKK